MERGIALIGFGEAAITFAATIAACAAVRAFDRGTDDAATVAIKSIAVRLPRIAPTAELRRRLPMAGPMRLYWPEEAA